MKPRRVAGDGTPLEVSNEEDLVDLLFDVFALMREHFTSVVSELGLAVPQAHALRHLHPDRSVPMGALAGDLHLDASTVTGIVDRLEQDGLVARTADPADRRVKALAITAAGGDVRARMCERLLAAAPPITALDATEQRELRRLLAKIVAAAGGPPASRPTVHD